MLAAIRRRSNPPLLSATRNDEEDGSRMVHLPQQALRGVVALSSRSILILLAAVGVMMFVSASRYLHVSRLVKKQEASGALPGKTVLVDDRPYYDMVIAVLVTGGDALEAQAEIERVRRVYSRYGDSVTPDGGNSAPLTLRVIFVVGATGRNETIPDKGLLEGDFLHLNVREGYRFLSDKTKAMMSISEHLRFRFLAKTDGDSFPCLRRVTQQLVDLPLEEQSRVYAGLLAQCGKLFPKGHKLHDAAFMKATGGNLPCHPMYHQGAFYVLGYDIVNHLHRSRDLLTVMSVEDAMVGLWLLAIDKVILDIGGTFYCECFTQPVPKQSKSFYHFCKTDEKIDRCIAKFPLC